MDCKFENQSHLSTVICSRASYCNYFNKQVAKLMLAVQSCAHGSEEGILTADMVKRIVSQKAREHGTKESMRAASRV